MDSLPHLTHKKRRSSIPAAPLPLLYVRYSYFKASIGFSSEALAAG